MAQVKKDLGSDAVILSNRAVTGGVEILALAQGEVVVVNEKFGIRLTDIITPSERIRKLNR